MQDACSSSTFQTCYTSPFFLHSVGSLAGLHVLNLLSILEPCDLSEFKVHRHMFVTVQARIVAYSDSDDEDFNKHIRKKGDAAQSDTEVEDAADVQVRVPPPGPIVRVTGT